MASRDVERVYRLRRLPTSDAGWEVVRHSSARQFATERAFYRYAVQHLRAAFPTLPARSQYNRLVRRCHDALVAVGQHLAALRDGRTSPYEALDGMGVPIRNAQRRGSGWLAGQADIGRCTRVGWYGGLPGLTAL